MDDNASTNRNWRNLTQFSLQSLLLSCVVFWTAVGALGTALGIAATVGLLGTAVYFRKARFMSPTVRRTCWIVASLAFVACYLALLVFARFLVGGAGPRSLTLNNLCLVRNGLREYEQKNSHFPPAFTVDSAGKRKLSWRTLLLPYIEYGYLFNQYNRKEPWDGPTNSKLPVPPEYAWTNHPVSETKMTCLAVVGSNTAWGEGKTWKPSDLPDGGKHTIILIAVADSDVKWCEPRDLTVDEAIDAIQAGPYDRNRGYFYHEQPGVTAVLFGDGRLACLPAHLRREALEPLLTTSDKASSLDIDQVIDSAGSRPSPKLRWDRVVCVSVLAGSYLLLLFRKRGQIPVNREE